MADDDLLIDPELTPRSESAGERKLVMGLGLVGVIAILLAGLGLYLVTNASSALSQLDQKIQAIETRPDRALILEREVTKLRESLQSLEERLVHVGAETVRAGKTAQGIRDQIQGALDTLGREIRTNREQLNHHADSLGQMNTVIGSLQRPAAAASTSTAESASTGSNAPRPEEGYHIIESGDTFEKLARRYGVSVSAIQQANPDLKPTLLRIGERVRIP